jgi:hypothetical protein
MQCDDRIPVSVLEDHAASIFRVEVNPQDGGIMIL